MAHMIKEVKLMDKLYTRKEVMQKIRWEDHKLSFEKTIDCLNFADQDGSCEIDGVKITKVGDKYKIVYGGK